MSGLMEMTERRIGDVTILELKGRMVLEEGDIPLRDHVNELARQGRLNILLDMRQVTRLDSAGIGMIVARYLTVHRRGGTMKLLNLTVRADHMMDVTRLTSIFEVFDSEEEAVRSFAALS